MRLDLGGAGGSPPGRPGRAVGARACTRMRDASSPASLPSGSFSRCRALVARGWVGATGEAYFPNTSL
jgi:hypothetical protein